MQTVSLCGTNGPEGMPLVQTKRLQVHVLREDHFSREPAVPKGGTPFKVPGRMVPISRLQPKKWSYPSHG